MGFRDYYYMLGIPPQATQKEITLAYKKMAKKWHPDANKDVDTTNKMQLLSEAYAVLKNEEKRKAYNVEYFRILSSKNSNQLRSEVRVERCYYCGKNFSNKKFSYQEILYKETERTHFPQRKVWYKTIKVEIPRCEDCFKIHASGSNIFLFMPLIAFPVLGIILGLTIWGLWALWLIVGAFIGTIIGLILSSIDDSIISKEAGIKKRNDISGFQPIIDLFKSGWTTTEPTA